MPKTLGDIRRGQLITTYGVGAIVAVKDESYMIAGIDRWEVRQPDLHEPRLERKLSVAGFVRPPANGVGRDIPVVRFPTIVSCRVCSKLARHSDFTSRFDNECRDCGEPLIPSRFIIACDAGHIDDFPFFEWVHRNRRAAPALRHNLMLETSGASSSLRDVVVKCSCSASETLEGAFAKHALRGVVKCHGRRPWLTTNEEGCAHLPRTLQRGASNVWFSVVESAISIPPWSEGAYKVINRYWTVLQHIPDASLRDTLNGMGIAAESGLEVDDLVTAVRDRRNASHSPEAVTEHGLRREEYVALINGKKEVSPDQEFVCESTEVPREMRKWISRVMLVRRLREVRALRSFSRVEPKIEDVTTPLADTRLPWLPAIEVMGEGVFLQLNEETLRAWEQHPSVARRAEQLSRRYIDVCSERSVAPAKVLSARFVLVHSLAHSLINQWSLDSGYPAASLRERLYAFQEGAGILIYTASSDSAGSLGGIVAQAQVERLLATFLEAFERAQWCSSDPVCIETDASGVDALNAAACHGCLLLPEVSCEERNVFLDRALLIGRGDDSQPNRVLGFFADLEAIGST
jgi:hypothetical protein